MLHDCFIWWHGYVYETSPYIILRFSVYSYRTGPERLRKVMFPWFECATNIEFRRTVSTASMIFCTQEIISIYFAFFQKQLHSFLYSFNYTYMYVCQYTFFQVKKQFSNICVSEIDQWTNCISYIYVCVCVCAWYFSTTSIWMIYFVEILSKSRPALTFLWYKNAFLVFCVYMDRSFRDKWNIKYETYVFQEYSAWDFDEHSLCIFIETQRHPRPHSHTYCEA